MRLEIEWDDGTKQTLCSLSVDSLCIKNALDGNIFNTIQSFPDARISVDFRKARMVKILDD